MQLVYGAHALVCMMLFSHALLAMDTTEEDTLPIVRIWDAEQGIMTIKKAFGDYETPPNSPHSASSELGTEFFLTIAQEKIKKLQQLFAKCSVSSLRFGQRELLIYQDIINLLNKARVSEDDFVGTLSDAQIGLISEAKKSFDKLIKRMLSHIDNGDVEKFRHAFLQVVASTYRPEEFKDLDNDDLEISITQLEGENNRVIEIKKYLDAFTYHQWIGEHPKKTKTVLIVAPAAFLLCINTLCYCIMHKLSKDDIISTKTVISIFALTNLLVTGMVVGFLCIFPLKFICCNKNTAKILNPAIKQMKEIVENRLAEHINLFAEAHAVLHARQIEQQLGASTSQDELLQMRASPPIPIPSRKMQSQMHK